MGLKWGNCFRQVKLARLTFFSPPNGVSHSAWAHSQELPAADRIGVPFEQVLEGRFIIGSPDECAKEIQKYQELGIQELILRCHWPGMPNQDFNRAVELFAQEVLPRFG